MKQCSVNGLQVKRNEIEELQKTNENIPFFYRKENFFDFIYTASSYRTERIKRQASKLLTYAIK
jgi:hypothetical protein